MELLQDEYDGPVDVHFGCSRKVFRNQAQENAVFISVEMCDKRPYFVRSEDDTQADRGP